ncbi:laminin subunit alpha-5 isoform X1 [Kryptolebias marmoratus]|uniref:laminin subunit alpha-5 isoform X1 n=1 Tax=Kryptolebias marmoratus TaxID=37003 RepID=UPI000D52FCB6|nr:laminin subunit alpha-5 isoform X1 [Kryptolebias marmoratus]
MMGYEPAIRLLWPLVVSCCRLGSAQELPANGLNGYSLHPPYFNLAEGTKITATATCGEDESGRSLQDLYCKLVGGPVSGDPSQTIQGQYCDICSKEDGDRAHPITNAIDGTERWWQSPPLSRSTEYNELNVTLDLGQLFHVAYVLIKFANSPRPDLWVLERSTDFGQTYQPWQYFASSKRDCIERFGQRTIERINTDGDIICTTEYSRIVPLENGEIVVSLVNGRPGAMNFSYSPVLREFTKATNIRLRFLRTNTLLGHLMGKALRDPTVTRRYYYSIKDISIGGRCVCNGHAEACNAKDPNDPYKLQCDCQHNTCGVSCDQCCPGYHQLQWKPATTYSANECEPCNCHRHSFDCYYDSDVDRKRSSLDLHGRHRGGGVCLNCQHHTTGVNCERCIPTYYRSPDHLIDSPLACSPCNCRSEFTDGTCEDLTGHCFCKPNYIGENCDSCASGFINFPECYPIPTYPPNNNGEAKPAGEIINCECSAAGTVDNSCRPDPRTRTCICKPGFIGDHCDTCAPGFYGLNCQACQCSGPGCLDGSCDLMTGHGMCQSGFQGYHCDQCAPGYFNYPLCQLCACSMVGSLPAGCDASGHCLCKPEFQGPRCEQCRSGFHSYPNCQACRCSPEGSRFMSCNQLTGQCVCLPGVGGLRCDSCSHSSYGFPNCQAGTCHPSGSFQHAVLPPVGQCECRRHVEGLACDKCKPLYWNLSSDSPDGCSNCECNIAGTLSTLAECEQETGQCHCKPNVCSGTCLTCKDGYYNLQDHNYFGCHGCRCDIGGSVGQLCEDQNGQCRCRPNIEGPKCNLPRPNHYFPDLHHLKFEIEEGTMLDGRPVRFGYNLLEFPDFSWRGYAQMSPIQTAVKLQVYVSEADVYLTRFILRYVNSEGVTSNGKITAYQVNRRGSEQSKQIIFAPSTQPTFVNVPQNNFVEPFVLNPGTWIVVIEAEGIFLDYLVLLPSAYYEAPLLQMRVTDPCTYSSVSHNTQNCLLYQYLSLDSFPFISGNDASCRNNNHLPRPCPTEKVTPRHPTMAVCSGFDISVDLGGRIASPGDYVLIVEYCSEEELPQSLSVVVNTPATRTHKHHVTLLHCKYSFLCRVVAVDEQNRVAVFSLPVDTQVQLTSDRASFFLNKVYLVPKNLFSMEYVEPKVHCISTHGLFSPDSSLCIPSRFQIPTNSLVLKEGQSSSTQEELIQAFPAAAPPLSVHQNEEPVWMGGVRPPFGADNIHHIRLDSLQNAAVYSARVQSLGRYVFILHYHQPLHPTYPVQIYINGGRIWQGITNASFCPHAYGCRNLLVSENQIILDVTHHNIFFTVQIPADKILWLDYVLVVPETSYSSSYLNEEPLDKSYNFISSCGQNSFYINPSTASPFCLSSAVSLSAFFNNGAMPCSCHEVGAESNTCEQFGGQCKCRPNVIGRDCSMCATGYWGFPNCRPCNCGPRLCEPVTGECICPPRTLHPDCTQCEPQTFGCHPVVGCEICNCSRTGVIFSDVSCDTFSGQCRCKNNVVGRQCDRCAPGFYGYPNCRPCDCNEAGTEEGVCESFTGQCLCKENVQGSRCDQCRIGTFHLDPTNPKGCTSCFCFGATDRCQSSNKRRTEIMDMEGWVLLGADRQEVPVRVYPDQDLVEADLSDVPDVYQDLHWHAPNKYLGDKISSYGGYLRYRLHIQTMRGDALPLPAEASRPDIILKGNQMTLVFMEREYSSPEEPHLGIVHIVEGSFHHAQTGNSVSREELMMVLVNLETLQIRALHSQSAHSVSLRGAVLEGAENLPIGRHANNVEICMCPANYHGDSCQTCAPGYYRDTIGLFLGKCVSCSCNGHSDQCLDGSGICMNCLHDTIGNHCERCKSGFHGNNSLDGQAVSCSSCPCPLRAPSNNFAEGCVQKNDRMQCLCMQGYAGPNCERCAPGFYGNPMIVGSRCQTCNCNGNTDPNMLFIDCHPLTGECLSCMHNTAGHHCDVCAPGYYGDAIGAKNCSKCSCSSCGTESCDPHTGQCHCKSGVTGARCEHCQVGSFGFNSCSGCHQCDCDASATLVQPCDPKSGQCACQPGVNGPTCSQCAPGYWDYGPNGCKKCDCRRGHCDPRTGDCHCPDGMTGKQCDTCSQQYTVPVETENGMHCESCDSCVIMLIEDLKQMNDEFSSVGGQLSNLNSSSMAWAHLHSLNDSIGDVAQAIKNYNSTLDDSGSRADMLEDGIININNDIDELQKKVEAMTHKIDDLDDRTTDTHQRAEDMLSFINNISMDINAILLANQSLNETETEQDEEKRERMMRKAQAMMREMRFRSCVGQKKIADKEKLEAEKLLDRVHKVFGDRYEENNDLTKEIGDRLASFHSDLMDLRKVLNEVVNNTARASEVNNVNEKTLEENDRRIKELLLKQEEVKDLLNMAEDDVTQVNDVLSMLQDSKEEYEHLAALLDGARSPLAKKVQNFASTGSQIPLVEKAERHAKLLNILAMNLSSVVVETRKEGTVKVTKAYSNIIDNINKAEEAANIADRAANDTLENIKKQSLGQMADKLKNRNMELNDEVIQLIDNLNNTLKPRLEEAQRRQDEAKIKHRQALKDLETIQNKLNLTSNVSQDIVEVKQVTGAANSTVTKVINQLRPIKNKLDEWHEIYGDTNFTSNDINNALIDANNTVSKLSETIPTLMRKLDELQNHSIQMPNISENINRIRQLIQQARNAASKVRVSMKFNGLSGVQVRTPSNLADLAAYNSLKFYITLADVGRRRRQDNIPKQFVFYLGNKNSSKEFLGMTREGKKLYWHYNIGGETTRVMMNKDVLSDGNFNEVFLQRILQYGQMSMSSIVSDVTEITKATVEAKGDQGLLNLQSSNTVFYVGGYPNTFSPPSQLASPNFTGGIELDTLNEEVISLYNFEKIFQLNTTEEKPYGRSKSTQSPGWVNEAAYFDGTGFAEISFTAEVTNQRFDLEMKLLSFKGILFLLHNESKFLCLAVLHGRLKVYYNFNGSLVEAKPDDPASEYLKISDGEAKSLNVIIVKIKQQIVVRQPSKTLFTIRVEDPPGLPQFHNKYYLGGVPQHLMPDSLKILFSEQSSVRACFRNVKANNNFINLKTMNSSGVSFGCEGDLLVAREAHFNGQSYLDLGVTNVSSLRSNFYISFSFRTDQTEGLMFYHQNQGDTCQVFLEQGHIVVRAGKSLIKTKKTYNDNKSHNVAVINTNAGMRLYMDDELEKVNGGRQLNPMAAGDIGPEGSTFLGGMPYSSVSNLTGCLSNVFIKSDTSPMVLNLIKSKENMNVPLSCPAAKKPQQIIAVQPKRIIKPKGKNKKPSGSRSRNTRESCHVPVPVPESRATHFSGSAHSYQRYYLVPGLRSSVLHFSLELKINSSSGCVLYAASTQQGRAVLSLSVSNGFLRLSFDTGKRKVSLRSNKKYNDGRWHMVFIRQEDSRISLIVNGISAQSQRIPGGTKTWIAGHLYIGGVPAAVTSLGVDAFIGCVRDLTLNRVPAGVPAHSQGTVPCYQSPLLPGAYFSGQGGHLETDEFLVLSQDVEVQLEVRPVSDSGLLLHAGTSADQHLSLVLSQGEVTVSVNSGKGGLWTSLTPDKPLCNGLWHTIIVVKRNNVLQLHVDKASNQRVGPKQNRSTRSKLTVYLGGKPSGVEAPGLRNGLPAFQGCIRNVIVNHRPVVLSEAVSVHGSVGTRGCPHI